MPEMPEVETVLRTISPQICGRRIGAVSVHWARTIATHAPQDFIAELSGLTFERCRRRAKYLVLELSSGASLITHLRMSGDLFTCPTDKQLEKHLRVRIELVGGKDLRFEDPRKFGRMYLVPDAEQILGRLGPEPLAETFSAADLEALLGRTDRPIKVALLDQQLLAGLGNIYVIESLWHAGIHPLARARRVRGTRCARLHAAIRDVLSRAVAAGGTDIGDGVWKAGQFETFTYGRGGEKCARCSGGLKHIVVAQRGTDFCPHCQKK